MSTANTMSQMTKIPCTLCPNTTLKSFLENGGQQLIVQCVLENAKGLDFETMMQDCTITVANALNLYDEKRMDVKPATYVWAACVNTIKMAYRRASAKKAKATAETVPVSNVGF